jgi:hypothetical protein
MVPHLRAAFFGAKVGIDALQICDGVVFVPAVVGSFLCSCFKGVVLTKGRPPSHLKYAVLSPSFSTSNRFCFRSCSQHFPANEKGHHEVAFELVPER